MNKFSHTTDCLNIFPKIELYSSDWFCKNEDVKSDSADMNISEEDMSTGSLHKLQRDCSPLWTAHTFIDASSV